MKKNISLSILVISMTMISCMMLYSGLHDREGVEENTALGKCDYPLIDISFESNKSWVVIDRYNLFTDEEKIKFCDNIEALQLNKEYLRLLTFPVGRGTTPKGIIYVYEDGKLVKETPYWDIYYDNKEVVRIFKGSSKENIEKLINSSLPSPV